MLQQYIKKYFKHERNLNLMELKTSKEDFFDTGIYQDEVVKAYRFWQTFAGEIFGISH